MRSGDNTYKFVTSLQSNDDSYTTPISRINAGGTVDLNVISSFDDDQILTLWVGVFGGGADVGQITARMALIEYIPA